MEEKIKVVTGSIALTGGAYVSAVAMFAVSVLMARYMAKDTYGLYVYVISMASMVYLFTDFGIDGLSSYFIMRYKDSRPDITRYVVYSSIKAKTILTILIFFILVLIGFFNCIYWYVAIFFIIFVANTFLQLLVPAFQHFLLTGKIQILESILKLIAIYLVLEYVTRSRLIIIIFAIIIPMSISVFLALKNILDTVPKTSTNLKFTEIKEEALYYGKWFLIMGILSPILMNIMQVALGLFLSFEKVAVFGIGKTLANSVVMFASSFKSSIAPSFVKKTEKKDIAFTLTDSIRYLLIIGVFFAFFIHFTSFSLVSIFYSEKYIESAFVFEILSYSMLFSLIFTGLVPATLSLKIPELRVKINMITVILLLILGSILIPEYGVLGAAFAFSTSGIIGTVIFAIITYMNMEFKFPWETLIKSSFAGFISFIPAMTLELKPIISIISNFSMILFYILILYLMKEFTNQDFQIIKKTLEVMVNFFHRR